MRMKKFLTLVLAVVMTAAVCAVTTNAADRILFGEVTVLTEGDSTIVSVQLLSKPEGKSVALIAAYMMDNGKILSVNSSQYENISLLEEDRLTVSVTDKSAEGASLKYYTWNSVSGIKPIENNPPASPLNVSASAELSKANLSWDESLDDYDASAELTYNIYDDGILIAENVKGLTYNADKLAWGTEYYFEVFAVDSECYESNASSVKAITPLYSSVSTTDVATSSPDGQLVFTGSLTENTKLHYCTVSQAGGLDCFSTTTRHNGNATYLCYKFSDEYLAKIIDDREFWVEITYFDEGTERIIIDIFGTGERAIVEKTDTNTWKTARKKLTTAQMTANTNEGNAYYNFRITDKRATGGLKIRDVRIMTSEEYTALNRNAGAYFVTEASTISCGLTSNVEGKTPETQDGRNAIKLSDLEENKCTFNVTESTVLSGNAVVEITYYAENEGTNILLNETAQQVPVAGKWRKMQFNVTDISTAENVITADDEIYINSIRVKSCD